MMRVWVLTGLDIQALELLLDNFDVINDTSKIDLFQLLQDPLSFKQRILKDEINGLILPTHVQFLEFFRGLNLQTNSLKFIAFLGEIDERWDWRIFDTTIPKVKILYPGEIYACAQAEYIIGSIISFYRHLHLADLELRSSSSEDPMELWYWQNRFQGEILSFKTVGFIGWNQSAYYLAKILTQSFFCKIFVWTENPSNSVSSSELKFALIEDKRDIISKADIICLNYVPLKVSPITKEDLAHLNQEALLINITSALVIDELDLLELLKEGLIKGAILDLFGKGPTNYSEEFFTFSNCLVTPRIATNVNVIKTASISLVQQILDNFG
jgi:phosphoglycerate dehydrogenase-like enzyme